MLDKITNPLSIFGQSSVGEMAKKIDWKNHKLGPVENWPVELKTAISIIVGSKFPMFISWGEERFFFYNDSYAIILGKKHPSAFGDKFYNIWSEIWNDIEPLILSVDRGEAVYLEDLKLIMNRFGTDEETYFTFSYSPLLSSTGKVEGLYCAVVETTRRKFAEEALKSERMKLRAVFAQAPFPIALLEGPDHKFAFANSAYVNMFLNGKDPTGISVEELLPDAKEQGFVKILDDVYATGKRFVGNEVEFKITDSGNGSKRFNLHFVYEPLWSSQGTLEGIVAAVSDVTSLVSSREEMREALKARDEFLSIASHELKTPLTTLKIQAQLQQRLLKKEDARAYTRDNIETLVYQIDKQVSRLDRLVDDMLDVSRIQTGRLKIEREQFNLCEVAKEVINRIGNQFEALSAPIPVLKTSDDTTGVWDRLRIEQVLINLLTNALKYGNKNPVTVSIEDKGETICLSVKDQGIGIAEHDMERIFDRFERSVDSNDVSGLGLGLFITKQIVLAHGGNISLQSELGKGTTFIVELPNAKLNT